MSTKRWVVVSSLGLGAALSCAEAEDQKADFDDAPDDGGSSATGGASAGTSTQGGKTSSAGSSAQGGRAGMGGAGGKAGSGGSTGNHAGTATEGGRAGSTSNEGGDTGSGGSSTAGSSTGGSASTALGCVVEAMGGMPSSAQGGAGEASGGAADTARGGASEMAGGAAGADSGPLTLFVDDFESGAVDHWTPASGTWAVIDDGSKVYEQSLLENKLQIAIAKDVCAADQIIEARIKVTEFKGQSNSYVAALFGRALSPSTHYLLALGSDKKLILRKRINSTSTSATAIGSAVAFTTALDQWYDVRFELIGTSLKGCVGDVCVTGTDSAIASGSIGVGTVNTTAEFDDVLATQP